MNLHSSHTRTKWDLNTGHIKFALQSCNVILQCILLSYFVDSGDSSEETSYYYGEYIRHIWSELGLFSILYTSLKGLSSAGTLACVASVSILFRSKERPRNGFLGFLAAREMTSPLTRAILRAVFDSRSSFFAPKQHENACYAGYGYSTSTPFHVILSSNTDMMFKVQSHS